MFQPLNLRMVFDWKGLLSVVICLYVQAILTFVIVLLFQIPLNMTASNADKIAATENTSPNTKVNGVASPSKEERWNFIIGKFLSL